jgi:hypothetical protein
VLPSLKQLKGMEVLDAMSLLDNCLQNLKTRIVLSQDGNKRFLINRLYTLLLIQNKYLESSNDEDG